MADLLPTLYGILGQQPPPGQELYAAAPVSRMQRGDIDGGAIAAGLAGGAIGAAVYAGAKGNNKGRQQALQLIEQAYKELGISSSMVWAVNPRSLMIFSASAMTQKPKKYVTRHLLKDVQLVEWGSSGGMPARKKIGVKIHDLPVEVSIETKNLDAFVGALHHFLQQQQQGPGAPAPGRS